MECRLCESDQLKLYYTQGNNYQFKFYKCDRCLLVNLDMSQGFDQGKYSMDFVDPLDLQHKQNKDKLETYKFIRKHIKPEGNYLDIGCGNGKLLQLAQNDGWEVHGLELSQYYADKIKESLNIEVTVANFLEFESQSKYNLVTLRHVFEHLPNSVLAMNKINRLLKENSYAVLEFPNIEGLSFKIKRFTNKLGFFKKKYSKDYIPGHCNEFSKKSFNHLLLKTGFEMTKWVTYSSKPLTNLIYRYIPVGCKTRVIIRKTSEAT